MLNTNGKVLFGVFSVVLVLTAIIPLALSTAGGNGKAKGNSCMATCLATQAQAEWYDLSNERVQECRYQCDAGVGEGVCTESNDGCCVLGSETDPDCAPTCKEVTIHVQDSEGEPVQTKVSIYDILGDPVVENVWTTSNGDYKKCLVDGTYKAKAFKPTGDPVYKWFEVPYDLLVTITV